MGDAVDGLEQLYNAATGRQVDPVLAVLSAAGLALDLGSGGLADVTAGVKAAYRISLAFARQGGGLVAEVIRAQFVQFAAGRLSPRALVNGLQQRFATIIELSKARGCGGFSLGNLCLKAYDKVSTRVRANAQANEVLQQMDGFLEEARRRGIPPREHLDTLSQFGSCFGYFNRGLQSLTLQSSSERCDLLELLRWRTLAFDPATNKWRAGEANSAIRYEQQYGGRLTRYEGREFDFQQGTTTFDVKGAVDPSQAKAFAARFNPRSFVDAISRYLKKVSS